MNLIEAKRILEEKDRTRNQLIGQKTQIDSSLNSLGYKNVEEAEKDRIKIEKEILKLDAEYSSKTSEFMQKYTELLNG